MHMYSPNSVRAEIGTNHQPPSRVAVLDIKQRNMCSKTIHTSTILETFLEERVKIIVHVDRTSLKIFLML